MDFKQVFKKLTNQNFLPHPPPPKLTNVNFFFLFFLKASLSSIQNEIHQLVVHIFSSSFRVWCGVARHAIRKALHCLSLWRRQCQQDDMSPSQMNTTLSSIQSWSQRREPLPGHSSCTRPMSPWPCSSVSSVSLVSSGPSWPGVIRHRRRENC